jgi:hypothetical protein
MKNPPLLNQVVQSLEQNENSARIKKLAFYIAKQIWAKDQNQLDSISLFELIQDLFNHHSNIETLKKNAYKLAQTLNKPEQYLIVASTIISELEALYNLPETKINLESDLITVPLVTTIRPEAVVAPDFTSPTIPPPKKKKIDPFDLRLKVMTQANPLKAKILLFSALEHQFDWSPHDLTSLRSMELYELIRNINYTCKSFEVLVSTLNSAARKLNEPHEYLAIANIISQALKPMYT